MTSWGVTAGRELALTIEFVPVDALKVCRRNARTHSRGQVGQIAAFGIVSTLIADAAASPAQSS